MLFPTIIYCLAVAGASLAGGLLPFFFRLTHTRMQVALSFVAGVMLGVGLLHLLPHGFNELRESNERTAIDVAVWWMLIGFMLMFFLERLFHFHHHDAPEELKAKDSAGALEHSHANCDHDHGHTHTTAPRRRLSWGGAAIGLSLHSLIDGTALAAGIAADAHQGQGMMFAGIGTFLAVFLHKPFDALTITTLMVAGGWSAQSRHIVNGLYALVTPLGVALFFLGVDRFGYDQHFVLGCALGFAAGAFLCIATSDLLPELQFHSHDRLKLSAALVLGIAVAWAIGLVEPASHGHGHAGFKLPVPARSEFV